MKKFKKIAAVLNAVFFLGSGFFVTGCNFGVVDEPNGPEAPDVPDTPDTPDVPDTPDTPDTPDVPDVPDTPDTPDAPGEVKTPDLSKVKFELPEKVSLTVDSKTFKKSGDAVCIDGVIYSKVDQNGYYEFDIETELADFGSNNGKYEKKLNIIESYAYIYRNYIGEKDFSFVEKTKVGEHDCNVFKLTYDDETYELFSIDEKNNFCLEYKVCEEGSLVSKWNLSYDLKFNEDYSLKALKQEDDYNSFVNSVLQEYLGNYVSVLYDEKNYKYCSNPEGIQMSITNDFAMTIDGNYVGLYYEYINSSKTYSIVGVDEKYNDRYMITFDGDGYLSVMDMEDSTAEPIVFEKNKA